jgi:hypothetical protein
MQEESEGSQASEDQEILAEGSCCPDTEAQQAFPS